MERLLSFIIPFTVSAMKNMKEKTSLTINVMKASATRRVARISVFTALCVVGSFIHPPSPIQSVAFDSFAGFFAALLFGVLDGALVSGIGHIATSVVSGFPLGPLHIPIAFGMASAGAAIAIVNKSNKKWGFVPAVITGVAINIALVVVVVPSMGWAGALAIAPFLLLAASLNALVAALAYVGLRGKLRV